MELKTVKKACFVQFGLRETVGKVSPILVTLTSRNNSDFERSNGSLKENKPDGVNPNSNATISTTTVERMKENFYGFRQSYGARYHTLDDYAKNGGPGEV